MRQSVSNLVLLMRTPCMICTRTTRDSSVAYIAMGYGDDSASKLVTIIVKINNSEAGLIIECIMDSKILKLNVCSCVQMLFLANSKQVLTSPSEMSIFGQFSTLCWFSIEYIQNQGLYQTVPIQFNMASTGLVCDRLLADIITKSAQRVSDNFLVKIGLNKAVLNSQNQMSDEMIMQAGVKSEHCTIHRQLHVEDQPQHIIKDEYMCKSMMKMPRKRQAKAAIQSRRNNNTNSNKCKTETGILSKQEASKSYQLPEGRDQEIQLKSAQVKAEDKMRNTWFARQISDKEDQVKIAQLQSMRQKSITKAKSHFKKQTAIGSNEYTYGTAGELIFYPKSNISKSINANYPFKLNPQISPNNLLLKRTFLKPKPKLSSAHMSPDMNSEHKLQSRQDTQFALKIYPQCIYNNNHQRQTSSVNYLHVKPGICYTEPSIGKSVRAESTKSDYLSTSRAKRSTFSKFFTPDSKSKTDGFNRIGLQNTNRKYSLKSMDLFKRTEGFYLRSQLQRKSRSVKSNGSIIDINEQLLEGLVRNN